MAERVLRLSLLDRDDALDRAVSRRRIPSGSIRACLDEESEVREYSEIRSLPNYESLRVDDARHVRIGVHHTRLVVPRLDETGRSTA